VRSNDLIGLVLLHRRIVCRPNAPDKLRRPRSHGATTMGRQLNPVVLRLPAPGMPEARAAELSRRQCCVDTPCDYVTLLGQNAPRPPTLLAAIAAIKASSLITS
jgi:hypothetical protein